MNLGLNLGLKKLQHSHADRLSNRRREGQKNGKKQQCPNENEMHDRVEEDEVMQEKLPHTMDPEFATPASQGKKGANKDREEETTQTEAS